jgi:hypothetical protein
VRCRKRHRGRELKEKKRRRCQLEAEQLIERFNAALLAYDKRPEKDAVKARGREHAIGVRLAAESARFVCGVTDKSRRSDEGAARDTDHQTNKPRVQ